MWLRMRDFLTLKVKDAHESLLMTDAKGSVPSLCIKAEATHSGIVNGNMRFYRPDRMQDCTHTWTPKGKPQRPVLLNHDRKGDCVGRVVAARYVDDSFKYTSQFPQVKNLTFYDSAKKLNLFKSVDWVMDNLHGKPDYKGLGYISLDLNITEPEAIRKVEADEYLTVSVGFATDGAICSTCHTDWAVDDKCEHELGKVYDGKPMFLITGNFRYSEMSFVNFPADPWGTVTKDSLKQISDSVANRVFFMGLPSARQKDVLAVAGLDMADAIDFLGSDIQPDTEEAEDPHMDIDAITKEIKADSLTKERALALRKELEAATDQKGVKRLLSTLNAKIRNNDWMEDSGPTKEQVEAKIEGLDAALAALPETDRSAYLDALEAEAKVFGIDFKVEEPAVVTPTPETPAADETKEEPVPAATLDPKIQTVIDTALAIEDAEKKYPNKDKILKGIEGVIALHAACNEDERCMLRGSLSAALEVFSAESWLAYMKSRLESAGDAVVPQAELDELHTAIEKYEADSKQKDISNQALVGANKVLIADMKQTLARVIVTGKVLLGETGFTGLSDEKIQQEIVAMSGRRLVSLNDSLNDLVKVLPGFEGKTSESKPTEAVKEVSDQAKVTEKSEPTSTEEAVEGSDAVKLPSTRHLDPKTARRLAIQASYDRRKAELTKTPSQE